MQPEAARLLSTDVGIGPRQDSVCVCVCAAHLCVQGLKVRNSSRYLRLVCVFLGLERHGLCFSGRVQQAFSSLLLTR